MNLWNWKKKETKKFSPPRLIQYEESNFPFYKKGAAIVRATRCWEELNPDFRFINDGRTPETHGRCLGGKPDCHHCQTIDESIKKWDDMCPISKTWWGNNYEN